MRLHERKEEEANLEVKIRVLDIVNSKESGSLMSQQLRSMFSTVTEKKIECKNVK